ncbi:MAG TPA: ATP-binding protein [bacterium]|jgi:anti-sigma regulatory factor (Ser/Thr protein kinase)|nr:ATP-binding protein [bacterium]
MEELALHILDLVQNSLVAGATFISITINENRKANRLTISVEDNGHGMERGFVARVLDPFSTTRTTRRVGLGLPLLFMTARQCGGDLTIDSIPGQGTKITAIFELNHWDLPPLGDMAATITTMLVGQEETEFLYRHLVDEAEFCFDTRGLKAELSPVPLTEPKVLVFLRRYIKDKLANLHGGG